MNYSSKIWILLIITGIMGSGIHATETNKKETASSIDRLKRLSATGWDYTCKAKEFIQNNPKPLAASALVFYLATYSKHTGKTDLSILPSQKSGIAKDIFHVLGNIITTPWAWVDKHKFNIPPAIATFVIVKNGLKESLNSFSDFVKFLNMKYGGPSAAIKA